MPFGWWGNEGERNRSAELEHIVLTLRGGGDLGGRRRSWGIGTPSGTKKEKNTRTSLDKTERKRVKGATLNGVSVRTKKGCRPGISDNPGEKGMPAKKNRTERKRGIYTTKRIQNRQKKEDLNVRPKGTSPCSAVEGEGQPGSKEKRGRSKKSESQDCWGGREELQSTPGEGGAARKTASANLLEVA